MDFDWKTNRFGKHYCEYGDLTFEYEIHESGNNPRYEVTCLEGDSIIFKEGDMETLYQAENALRRLLQRNKNSFKVVAF